MERHALISIFVSMRWVFICFVVMFSSCHRNGTESVRERDKDTLYFAPGFEYIHIIPDSLRTEEQEDFLKDLQRIIIEHQKVENNEIIFTLSREEFVDKGFPEEYYILIQKDLRNNNKFFKENNILNLDSILEHSYKDLK